jgi:hypothetical protein
MFALVSTFGVVAGLSALSPFCLLVASRLPPPFRSLGGAEMLGFELLVYVAALISLLVGAARWPLARIALHSRFKYLFVASALVILGYTAFVSYAMYSLSQATDL